MSGRHSGKEQAPAGGAMVGASCRREAIRPMRSPRLALSPERAGVAQVLLNFSMQ